MDGYQLTIVLVAVVIGSVSKAVTGMGLPVIVIPVAALFVDIEDAVVIIALPNLLANGVLAIRERAHLPDTRNLGALASVVLSAPCSARCCSSTCRTNQSWSR